MADAKTFEPQTFTARERDGAIDLDELLVQRAVETDHAGISRVHVWLTGRAVVRDDQAFERVLVNLALSLYERDRSLGVCAVQDIVFETQDRSRPFTADEDLRIGLEDSVTRVEARVEVTKTLRSSAALLFDLALPDAG